jgi:hypothetical protein
VTDCSGNLATAEQTIKVVDTLPPLLHSKVGQDNVDIAEVQGIVFWNDPKCVDNCDTPTPFSSPMVLEPGSCNHNYKNIYTWWCEDICGNSVSKSYTVNVHDKVPPVLIGVPNDYQTWPCDDPRLEDYAGLDTVTATDNSIIDPHLNRSVYSVSRFFQKSRDTSESSCDDEFMLILEWYALDECNNRAEATVTIHVWDNRHPTITKPPMFITTDDCNVPTPDNVVNVSDNCADVSVVFHETRDYDNECQSQYTIYRTWSVVDNCGNAPSPVTQTIFIVDRTPPKWVDPIPEDYTVECFFSPDYDIFPAAVDDNCYDNETHLELIMTEKRFDEQCDHQFKVRRKWTVQDCLNNFLFGFQTVTIIDDTPPYFTQLPNDATAH